MTTPTALTSMTSWERRLLAGGALGAVLQLGGVAYFVAAAAPHMPPIDAPHTLHAAFYADYWRENALANFLNVLPMPFFLLFLGGLLTTMRRAEGAVGAGGALTTTATIAGAALSVVWPIGVVIASTGQAMAKQGLDPATVFTFDSVAQTLLALSAFPRSVFLLAASLAMLETGLAPRWLGWSGVSLGLVAFATAAGLVLFELFPFLAIGSLLFQVWLLALSGTLLSRPRGMEPRGTAARSIALAAG